MKRSSIKLFIILGVSEEYEDLTWWHFPPLYLGCNFQSRILLTCPQMTHKMRDGAVGRWTMSQHPATFVVCNPGVLLQKSRQTFSVNDQIESLLGFTSVQLCCCRVKQTYRTCAALVPSISEWSGLSSSVPLFTERTSGCRCLPASITPSHACDCFCIFLCLTGPVPFRLTSEW